MTARDATLRMTSLASQSASPRRWSFRHASTVLRPANLAAVTILGLVVLMAVVGPVIIPIDPAAQDLGLRLRPPLTTAEGQLHLLGTDQLGRDVLARIIHGSRVSLLVGFSSIVVAGTLGLAIGLAAGYFGNVVDIILMRSVDILMAFPFILLALATVAILGPSVRNVIIVFALTSWPVYARTSRALVLSLRDREFVLAARASGATHDRLLIRHILPNVLNPIVVIASFGVAQVITSEAALTFLGAGIPPLTPSWGQMISEGRQYLQDAWWIATFPGLMLLALIIAINLCGDLLRDLLDPQTAR